MQWQTKLPLIAILRGITPQEVQAHVIALLAAGFDAVEIPLNSPQWQQSIASMVAEFGDKALIGAGTVLKTEQVDELAAMGSKLMVTPNTQPEVIRRAVANGMTVCAGCATASEAFSALDAGAQTLKIFPSSAFGPDYIKALKAVLPPEVAGICCRRRYAGKPAYLAAGRLCRSRTGQRFIPRRAAGEPHQRKGKSIC
ncbi:2-dehydro-3-deoxy-6-phosphogalactonate aldolase [Cedecea neteri]|uniref:2-dehydro-3-deoxy-6-phosphogalactonate aldolase n=1 Tax=Cedecea neteri TaxID=158822 RepID=A0A2X2SZV6_9ENTR|nr:2-dehydro-3-deoxy-6-phosphogalactonate aldolase [Cedecea neteri]